MEHSIHLGAGHFIEGVSPTAAGSIIKKMRNHKRQQPLNESDNDEGSDGDDDGTNEDTEALTAGDAVGKGLALVNQVKDFVRSDSYVQSNPNFVDSEVAPSTSLFQEDVQRGQRPRSAAFGMDTNSMGFSI